MGFDHDLIRRNAEWRARKEQLEIMTTYARRLELVICTMLTTSGVRSALEPPTVAGVVVIMLAVVLVPLLLMHGPARRKS